MNKGKYKELINLVFHLGYGLGRDELTKDYDSLNKKYHNLLEFEAEKISGFLNNLKVEERELTLEEKKKIYERDYTDGVEVNNDHWLESKLTTRNIPTKLIILTYKDEKIEVYE